MCILRTAIIGVNDKRKMIISFVSMSHQLHDSSNHSISAKLLIVRVFLILWALLLKVLPYLLQFPILPQHFF